MYGIESSFWLKLILLLAAYSMLLFLFNTAIRKWLGVEKPKAFSHNHVNAKHSKIDWSIRGVFIVLILIGGFINATRLPQDAYWFLQPWSLLFVLIAVTETVRAFMEKKYAKNPKAYLFTVFQLGFMLVLIVSLFATDFFGIL